MADNDNQLNDPGHVDSDLMELILVPCYVLDGNFRFVDWNAAFDHLVARPLGLTRGMHATSFVSQLVNVQEVMRRSIRVFAAGQNPLTDSEELIIAHPRYGHMRAKKHARRLSIEGETTGWVVSLVIHHWEHRQLDLLADIAAASTRSRRAG